MEFLAQERIERLLQETGFPSVSIFFPTESATEQVEKNRLMLKNRREEVQQDLEASGIRASEARAFLQPIADLEGDNQYWQNQRRGLGIFRSREIFDQVQLPYEVSPLGSAEKRFHIKPLLKGLDTNRCFYLLAITRGEVELMRGSPFDLKPLDPDSLPEGLREVLRFDDPEKQLQFHTKTEGVHGVGEQAAAFHGHGVGGDPEKETLLRYFQRVNKGVEEVLGGEELPLVLAGLESHLALYREANTYPHLLQESVEHNPEKADQALLHEKAWKIMQGQIDSRMEEIKGAYLSKVEQDQATDRLEGALPAAHRGRLSLAMISEGKNIWGRYQPVKGELEIHPDKEPEDEELLNALATFTLRNDGEVYVLPSEEMPGGEDLAVIMRF